MPCAASQRGVALVTAMFVVAIVATLATFLAVGQQVWLRQVQNLSNLSQADGIGRGAISLAGVLLMHDAKETKIDDLTELWNKPLPPLPVEGGFVTIRLMDAQGRFNLNNLVTGDTPNPPEIAVFQRLLTQLDLDINLSEAVVDWLDTNSNVQPGGAEDLDYINLPTPYRTANTALESVDELKNVKGFTADIVDKLRPFVIALPGNRTEINVNTAEPEVLAALTGMPASAMKAVVEARDTTPFTDVTQFDNQVRSPQPIGAGRGVITNFFIVTVETSVGRIVRRTEALLQRDTVGKPPTVRWQQPARWQVERSKPDA